jgi:hypothetical protein
MKKFIKQLTLEDTYKSVLNITSRFPPIRLSTLQLTLIVILTIITTTLSSFSVRANNAIVTDETTSTANINDISNIHTIQSYSSGQITSSSTKTLQDHVINTIHQRVLLGDSDQKQNKALNTTRDEVMTKKHQQARNRVSTNLDKNRTSNTGTNIAKKASMNNARRSVNEGSFVIHDGYSQLIEDYDEDGYFQTFSVTFDADLVAANSHDEAVVSAELYLSKNGGPWVHYYSTDNFLIHGDSSDDEFEVYSTLEQGFSTNQYNILIDLYEDGYPSIIASYSSDDSNSLYALPLESSDYDVEYVPDYTEEHIHGGSYSLYSLLILMGMALN